LICELVSERPTGKRAIDYYSSFQGAAREGKRAAALLLPLAAALRLLGFVSFVTGTMFRHFPLLPSGISARPSCAL
jgi:hypothetical protein